MSKKNQEAQLPVIEQEEELMPKKSKGRKIANTIINVVLVLAIVVAAFCTYTSYVSTSGNGVPPVRAADAVYPDRLHVPGA